MKSAEKARNNGLYRHIRTSKEIIRNLLNDSTKYKIIIQRKITKKLPFHVGFMKRQSVIVCTV